MVRSLRLYLDDSGTRHPTHRPGKQAKHNHDWFALGGILIRDEDEKAARALHADFIERWPAATGVPLHSSEIRSRNEGFAWLRTLEDAERDRFYEDLYILMRDAPVIGIACVVDRPGYRARYLEKYQQQPWMLCKTAFSIVVERAAKFARGEERRLRVHPERCNKAEDNMLRGYYQELKANGSPFAAATSEKYGPLSQEELNETLYELDFKFKSSPMAQLADLYLWPMCMGGYHAGNRPYQRLREDGKLIESHVDTEALDKLATKYSCFDMVERAA